MERAIVVKPTRIEYLLLRRKLATARKVHKVLSEKLLVLSQELIRIYHEVEKLYAELYRIMRECKEVVEAQTAITGGVKTSLGLSYVHYPKRIYGVRIPSIKLANLVAPKPETLAYSKLAGKRERIAEVIRRICECEGRFWCIVREAEKVSKKVRNIENNYIPMLIQMIQYLKLKFEEREREEKLRSKRIKMLLEKRLDNTQILEER